MGCLVVHWMHWPTDGIYRETSPIILSLIFPSSLSLSFSLLRSLSLARSSRLLSIDHMEYWTMLHQFVCMVHLATHCTFPIENEQAAHRESVTEPIPHSTIGIWIDWLIVFYIVYSTCLKIAAICLFKYIAVVDVVVIACVFESSPKRDSEIQN